MYVQVATEAMEKKNVDMNSVVRMDPPDLKRLQLLLGGSISAQVNQGVQEYALFLREPLVSTLPDEHVERLKDAYRWDTGPCREGILLERFCTIDYAEDRNTVLCREVMSSLRG